MRRSKRVRWVWALVPLAFGLAGCGENNENNVKVQGATTAPGAVSSAQDATTPPPDATKQVAPKGYPGARR